MSDLISRSKAIRWVKAECNPYGKPTLDYESGIKVIEHLERMSSVQSEKRTEEHTETHACDLIDRQAAIDALFGLYEYQRDIDPTEAADLVRQGIYLAEKKIEQLPSAQPDLDEWCTDCKEYDTERNCCPRFNKVIREALKEVKKDDWVSCSERLPERDGEYLVTYEKGYAEDYGFDLVGIAPFEVDCEGFGIWQENFDLHTLGSLGSDWVDIPVIAWMPLPKPYKEGDAK